MGAVDRGLQQRGGDGHLGGLDSTVLTVAAPMPMRAPPASCMTDLTSLKSTLMRPGVVMSLGDALDALEQHLVGLAEGLDHGDVPVRDGEQTLALGMTMSVSTSNAQRPRRPRPGWSDAGPRS